MSRGKVTAIGHLIMTPAEWRGTMARFLMATMPMVGHVNPGLPIARRLMARGHEVCLYTGQRFQKRIEATEARFAPMREAHVSDDRDLNAAVPARSKLSGLNGQRYD